ncbi:hypothetical protein Pcinc_003161 [Petrolisthes cinctipes]|uniref:Uncharacterized protein n=1 Tax=Petrolisthes cinctipes TaxID=88211 RepID=A0AAE1GJF2_PETCI|nr:hypothetical protein Pcinc_003161 [Petrolisthes cinctipes]
MAPEDIFQPDNLLTETSNSLFFDLEEIEKQLSMPAPEPVLPASPVPSSSRKGKRKREGRGTKIIRIEQRLQNQSDDEEAVDNPDIYNEEKEEEPLFARTSTLANNKQVKRNYEFRMTQLQLHLKLRECDSRERREFQL